MTAKEEADEALRLRNEEFVVCNAIKESLPATVKSIPNTDPAATGTISQATEAY